MILILLMLIIYTQTYPDILNNYILGGAPRSQLLQQSPRLIAAIYSLSTTVDSLNIAARFGVTNLGAPELQLTCMHAHELTDTGLPQSDPHVQFR